MAGLQDESLAAIVQKHTGPRPGDAAAKAVKQRVDEAAGIAVLVDDRQVDRIRMTRQHDVARWHDRPLRIDGGDQIPRIVLRQEGLDRDVGKLRIADEKRAGAIGLPACLDFVMDAIRRERTARANLHQFRHVEQQQSNHALPVGWAFRDGITAELGRDRRDVVALRLGKILQRVQPAEPLQPIDHVLGHRPFVKRFATAFGNRLERRCQFRKPVHGADARCLAVDQIGCAAVFVAGQRLDIVLPGRMNHRRHWKTVFGEIDGRRQHVGQ